MCRVWSHSYRGYLLSTLRSCIACTEQSTAKLSENKGSTSWGEELKKIVKGKDAENAKKVNESNTASVPGVTEGK